MRKLVLFMHVSLDGFVAGPDGEMDWIHVDDEIFDYAGARTNAGDTALYGRKTYQMMEAYWPTAGAQPGASRHDREHSAWYNKVTKVVISRTMKDVDLPRTRIVSGDLGREIGALKQAAGKEIVIFGSPGAAQSLMAEDLIDDYWLFVNPVLLGRGIALFQGAQRKASLALTESQALGSGVVCLHYTRKSG
jgi:dihydrofolate reductase